MSVSNSHQISRYYDFYRDKEIVFTKANLKSLRIDPRQIYLKSNGGQWPCIVNSASLMQAKVIIGTSSGIYAQLQKTKNLTLSLRFCFIDNSNNPIHFFVNCVVYEIKSYQGSNELVLVTLNFTQRPPDDLISRLGEFIEVNENFKNRREERILINKDTLRELQIPKEETFIFIANVPRKCIIKDLSFGGAKVMMIGVPKFLEEKQVDLRLIFLDTTEKLSLPGIVKNAEFLPGRKDIVTCNIEFIPETIPMTYKFKINAYITSYQKQMIDNQILNKANQEKAEAAELARQQQIKAQALAQAQKNQQAEQGNAPAAQTVPAQTEAPQPAAAAPQAPAATESSSQASTEAPTTQAAPEQTTANN